MYWMRMKTNTFLNICLRLSLHICCWGTSLQETQWRHSYELSTVTRGFNLKQNSKTKTTKIYFINVICWIAPFNTLRMLFQSVVVSLKTLLSFSLYLCFKSWFHIFDTLTKIITNRNRHRPKSNDQIITSSFLTIAFDSTNMNMKTIFFSSKKTNKMTNSADN